MAIDSQVLQCLQNGAMIYGIKGTGEVKEDRYHSFPDWPLKVPPGALLHFCNVL
jgi:hypothetical protein